MKNQSALEGKLNPESIPIARCILNTDEKKLII
jgi:hypothetical protein